MVQAAIFDMDGLLVETEEMWQTFWPVILAKRDIEYIPEQGLATTGTTGAVQAKIMRGFYGEDLDAEAVWEETKELAHERFMSATAPLCKGVVELLEYLRANGVPMAVASSSDIPLIEHHLSSNGIREYFDVVVSGDEIPRGKPFPDIFLIAAERLGNADPAHSLVLEDSFNGVRAGQSGNFITVMVPSVIPPDDEMREKASVICDDLLQVRSLLEQGKLG